MSIFHTVGKIVMKAFGKTMVGPSENIPFDPTIHLIQLHPKEIFTHVHKDIYIYKDLLWQCNSKRKI